MSLSLSARMRGGGDIRSPDACGEADGTGLAVGGTDAPGTTGAPPIRSSLAPETGRGVSTRSGGLGKTFRAEGRIGESMQSGLAGSSLAPETGIGVSTRSGGLGETFRAGGLGEYMRSSLAHGAGFGDSLRSGLGPVSGRGESILPALGRWTKNITTPTGQGNGGLTASFCERTGPKTMGLSDAMSTPHNLENFPQQKGDVYMTKEGEEENSASTSGGGEWADVVGRCGGRNSWN
jgi:hypothetical protein